MVLCYTKHMKKRTTIWLDEADRVAIAAIRARYGVATESDAMRLAVRLLAESKQVDIQPPKEKRK